MTSDDLDRWLFDDAESAVTGDAQVFVTRVMRRIEVARRRRRLVLGGAACLGSGAALAAMRTATPDAWRAIGTGDVLSALVLVAWCALVWVTVGMWPAVPADGRVPGPAGRTER